MSSNLTFTGIKYTSAGRVFAKSQSSMTQEILAKAEKKMRNHRYTNLVVNRNGYVVQFADKQGRHSYKIDNILYSCDDVVNFHVKGKSNKVLKFDLSNSPKKYYDCAVAASEDARLDNYWLNSSIELANLLEKRGKYPIKPHWTEKIKEIFDGRRMLSFLF